MKKRKILITGIIILLIATIFLFLNLGKERFDISASENKIKETQQAIKNNSNNDKNLIATLTIKNIVEDVPVFNNAADDTLLKGAGAIDGSTGFNEIGNTFVAGHRETVFNNLDKLKLGDVITIKSLKDNKTSKYKVEKIKTMKNDDTFSFYEQTNKNRLVLYTCYPIKEISTNPKEIIVFYAELLE